MLSDLFPLWWLDKEEAVTTKVQIVEGIGPGSRIVVEGHRDIDQGHKLNVVRVISDPLEVLL